MIILDAMEVTIVTSGTDGFVYVHANPKGLFLTQHTKQMCPIDNIHTCSYVGDWAERGDFPGDSPHTVNVFKVSFQFCYTKSDTNIPYKVVLVVNRWLTPCP